MSDNMDMPIDDRDSKALVKGDFRDDKQLPAVLSETNGTLPTVQTQVVGMLDQAGTIEFTKEQKEILFAPVDEEAVEIREDGMVYMPHCEYRRRLTQALGGQWAMLPVEVKPKLEGNLMLWGFFLFIQGKPMGFAWGEQTYQPTNPRMTYGDAMEGAKSNALTRLCKDLGIAGELWQPTFIKAWKAKYAESYSDQGRRKWRKKGVTKTASESASEAAQEAHRQHIGEQNKKYAEELYTRIWAQAGRLGHTKEVIYKRATAKWKKEIKSLKELSTAQLRVIDEALGSEVLKIEMKIAKKMDISLAELRQKAEDVYESRFKLPLDASDEAIEKLTVDINKYLDEQSQPQDTDLAFHDSEEE